MGLLTISSLKLITSGIGLASQILARTSPSELKDLEKLEKLRLKYEGLITDYKRLNPSERNQAKLEIYIQELEKVCNEILIMQKFAETKLRLILSQDVNSSNSSN